MAVRSGGQAPYAPPQTVIALIHAFRNRPLQTPLAADVLMRAGVSDSLVPRVTASLKLLDLVNDDLMPTPEFEGLRRASQAEYHERLAAIVRTAYAEIFQYFDPITDDEEKARDIFRHYEPLGQLARIVRLFLGLCDEARIIPDGKLAAGTPAPKRPASKSTLKPTPKRSVTPRGIALPGDTGGGTIPPALMGLLASLPANGRGWTDAQRQRFMTAFSAVLDFSIPVLGLNELQQDDSDDDAE